MKNKKKSSIKKGAESKSINEAEKINIQMNEFSDKVDLNKTELGATTSNNLTKSNIDVSYNYLIKKDKK